MSASETKSAVETKNEKKKPEDPLKKFKVANKYDPYILKNSLDECIKEVIKDKYKFPESHHYENIKIVLGTLICLVVALSHYYPLPFPLNYNLIIACVIVYAILSGIYTYYEARVENDCFILFKGDFSEKWLRLSSKIKLCSEFYEINLAERNKPLNGVTIKRTVGDFFDIKGNIHIGNVEKLIEEIFKQFKSLDKNSEKKAN